MNDNKAIDSILRSCQFETRIAVTPSFQGEFEIVKPSATPSMPFHYVEEGSVSIQMGEKTIVAETGDVVILPTGKTHSLLNHPDMPDVKLICGDFQLQSVSLSYINFCLPDIVHLTQSMFARENGMLEIFSLIKHEANSIDVGSEIAANTLTSYVMIHIIRYIMNNVPLDQGVLGALSDQKISKALNAFHDNIGDEWTVQGLASIAGMSRASFSEHFKKQVGETPIAYITRWRMDHARELLRHTNKKVFDIAKSCGYQNESAFSRAFKSQYGKAPSECRHW